GILGRYSPLVEGLSLDEAFLDVTGEERLFGDGRAIAHAIKAAVRAELAIVASVGVAPAKPGAKSAGDIGKPRGPGGGGAGRAGGGAVVPRPAPRRAAVGRRRGPAKGAGDDRRPQDRRRRRGRTRGAGGAHRRRRGGAARGARARRRRAAGRARPRPGLDGQR